MRRSLWPVVIVVAVCLLWARLVGPYGGFIVARVDGRAMESTIHNQDRLIVNTWSYMRSTPHRGDIVMMRYPRDPSKTFVKRVIAGGGESVRIEDGRVFVNDTLLDEPYVDPVLRSHDDYPTELIAADHYFVLGDHRNNSSDSRTWGLVPAANIVGRITLRWWPSLKRF